MGTAVATLLRPFGLLKTGPKPVAKAARKARAKAKVVARKKATGRKKAGTGGGFISRLKSVGTYSGLAAAVLVSSLVLVAGYQFLLLGPVLGLERITIKGLDRITSSQVLVMAQLKQGLSLLQLDTSAIRHRLEASPWVESATVRRVLPDELSITIIERHPVAVVQHKGRRWYVDGSGQLFKLLSPGEKSKLPVIKSSLDSLAGRENWQPYAKAGRVIQALEVGAASLGLGRVGSLSLDKHKGLIIHPAEEGPSLILGREDPDLSFTKLVAVTSDLKAKGLWGQAKYIDLRFDERVYVGFGAGKG